MLHGKKTESASIPIKMTKVLLHDSLEGIGFLARGVLEAIQNGELLEKNVTTIRRLMGSPPVNSVALRRDIADTMIRYGRYAF